MIKATHAWERAAACEAHARATDDIHMQTKFRKLRDSWIRLGNQASLVDYVGTEPIRPDTGMRAAAIAPH